MLSRWSGSSPSLGAAGERSLIFAGMRWTRLRAVFVCGIQRKAAQPAQSGDQLLTFWDKYGPMLRLDTSSVEPLMESRSLVFLRRGPQSSRIPTFPASHRTCCVIVLPALLMTLASPKPPSPQCSGTRAEPSRAGTYITWTAHLWQPRMPSPHRSPSSSGPGDRTRSRTLQKRDRMVWG